MSWALTFLWPAAVSRNVQARWAHLGVRVGVRESRARAGPCSPQPWGEHRWALNRCVTFWHSVTFLMDVAQSLPVRPVKSSAFGRDSEGGRDPLVLTVKSSRLHCLSTRHYVFGLRPSCHGRKMPEPRSPGAAAHMRVRLGNGESLVLGLLFGIVCVGGGV